jgi:tricorn protease
VTRAPIEPDNFDGRGRPEGQLLLSSAAALPSTGAIPSRTGLFLYSIKDRKESSLATEISGLAVSADGSKALVKQDQAYNLYEVKPDAKDKKTVLPPGLAGRPRAGRGVEGGVRPRSGAAYRDFFYVKNMHGYDWKALGERYRRPSPRTWAIAPTSTTWLGELVAELSVGHAYIEGVDWQAPERPKVGLPGARFELDRAAAAYRIARIFKGSKQEDPLSLSAHRGGRGREAGDYVLEIDGIELKGNDDPYRLLRHKTDLVTLTLNARPAFEGARKTSYRPIQSEEALLYLAQVEENRERVSKLTNGRVGYLHVPDMGPGGGYEFLKWFYPQIRKEGLVVDVRSNGGGNISPWLIERLDTRLLGTGFSRMDDYAQTYPQTVFHGPMAWPAERERPPRTATSFPTCSGRPASVR